MFSKFSVKKPYTVLVGVLLVIVLGVVSITRMTTDLLPDMSLQYALIMTTDIGASPEQVEKEVTSPIESQIATTTGIENIGSMSYNSYSIVTCEYGQNVNMDSVVIEIQQKLDQLSGIWGDNVGTPMIIQINPDMLPIMMSTVDVKGMNASEITNYVNNELVPALESVEGVASVSANGMLEEKVVVTMDQDKIDALNEQIQQAIENEFVKPTNELNDAESAINAGQSALTQGQNQLSDTIEGTLDQRESILQTEADLNTQLADLNSRKESLTALYNGITAAMEAKPGIPGFEDKTLMETGKALEDAIAQTNEVLNGPMASYMTPEQLAQTQAQLVALQAGLDGLNSSIATQFTDLSALGIVVDSYDDLAVAQGTISGMITQVNTGISAIETGLEQIAAGKIALADGLDVLNANAALAALQMGSTSSELAVAASSIEDAKTTLEEAKENALDSADLNNILSIDTLSGLLVAQNFDMPAGYANEENKQYLVRVGKAVKDVDELEDLVLLDLGFDNVGVIRLSDVATIEVKDNSEETYAIVNGNPGITLLFEKQTGYSTGDVTDRLLERFERLEKENENLSFGVLMDQGIYIDLVVNSVLQNMIIGAILAVLILALFLKDWKPTVVIACSIPLSVVVAIVLMYFTNISLNIISMSGLMLGIGMLVDNSIVVIENIYRLRSEGYSVKKAAVEGAKEVSGAIIASTLTTVSVYAPIIFTDGLTRQLFVDLALTIAFTLVASLLVALTVVPAVSSFTLRKTKEIKHPWFNRVKEWYGVFLAKSLRYKAIVFIVSLVLLVVSAVLALSRGLTFMELDMETNQLSLTIAPKDDKKLEFDELTARSDEVLERISDIEGIDTIAATAGGSTTMNLMSGGSDSVSVYILLDEKSPLSLSEVEKEILERTEDVDAEITTSTSSMDFTSFFGSGLSVKIKGQDLDTLQEIGKEVASAMEGVEGTIDVDDGLSDATPEWRITVDREKAAEYGYTVAQVFQLVYEKMADSSSATTITTDIKDYEVYIQTEEQSAADLSAIKELTFEHTNKDNEVEEIPLTEICTMEEKTTLGIIYRDAQTRYLTVSCGIDENHNVTLVGSDVEKAIKNIRVPEGYTIEMAGEDETIYESMSQMLLMMLLAIIFIYLIMVAQFQSLKSPFIIIFSIPLAFTGGFLGTFLSGEPISIISMLGFIMLAGIIVNNGIVFVDYINQARIAGESKHDAIVQAGITRLRPILMTTLTTVLAMSTTAAGLGDGAESMRPMAVTMIGGLIYGTLLTLIVIPCVYDVFHKEKDMTEEEL